jgi:alkanesulfonate monooxygenase SsuD/methylene tetrahydromethanopterin reductase-like flavin-dependent oxidoreductase (luciferase family)
VKFGLFLAMHYRDVTRPYGELLDNSLELCIRAEELGYDAIFIPEHHFINYITLPSALQFATKVAAHTRRIRLITAVIVMPYYHPLALAEEVALTDWLTDGRLEIGVARGANKYEFVRLGIDWDQSRDMFEEALDVMLASWEQEDFAYEGTHYRFPPTTTIPRPKQLPHPPVWITAQSLPGARNVARRGVNLMTSPNFGCFAPYKDVVELMTDFNRAQSASGHRRPHVGLQRRVFVAETEAEALRHLDDLMTHWRMYMAFYEPRADRRLDVRVDLADTPVVGGAVQPARLELDLSDVYGTFDDPVITTPDKAIRRLRLYEQLGVTHLMANMAFGEPQADVLRSLELFAREVMPHFAEPAAPPAPPPELAGSRGGS